MISLVELEFANFRSFKEKTLINFSKNGIILISGQHISEDTGSGTGKSTISMAIAYALGICDLPATKLKNWSGDSLYVRLRLSIGNDFLDIIRSPKLQLIKNGIEIPTMSSDAENKLISIIGVDLNLAKLLTYRPQRVSQKFIDLTDSQQKELLTQLLNLNEFEKAADKIISDLSLAKNQNELAVNLVNQLKSLPNNDIAYIEKQIEEVSFKINQIKNRLSELSSDSDISNIKHEINQYSQEINKIQTLIKSAEMAKIENNKFKPAVENLLKEIETMKVNKCPTCFQNWDENFQAIINKQEQLNNIKTAYKSNLIKIKAIEPYEQSNILNDLQTKKDNLISLMARMEVPKNQLHSNLNDLIQLNNQLQFQLNQEKNKNQKIQQAKEEELESASKIKLLEHAQAILGRQGFLGSIFDEILQDIQLRANRFMSNLPNINTISLEFSSETVTKVGKINKKINTILWKDGQSIEKKVLSGGQQASIELSVDLALAETIRARSGINLGWMILDETMDGLDYPTKAAIVETIKKESKGLILLIDHATEIKEMCDENIKVYYDGQKSWIR